MGIVKGGRRERQSHPSCGHLGEGGVLVWVSPWGDDACILGVFSKRTCMVWLLLPTRALPQMAKSSERPCSKCFVPHAISPACLPWPAKFNTAETFFFWNSREQEFCHSRDVATTLLVAPMLSNQRASPSFLKRLIMFVLFSYLWWEVMR